MVPAPSRERPIGVFDSGLGGLTVARALLDRLPAESLLYVGDTARVPYGPKSPETVRRYAEQIAAWLVESDVKAIVVACNTATAHALPHLRATFDLPVIGVVEPGARAAVLCASRRGSGGSTVEQGVRGAVAGGAASTGNIGVIGVIGTAGTVASGAYDRAIHALAPDAVVHSQACALFVPLVEEGWLDHAATRLIAEEYLAPLRSRGVHAVVLGCTHYPLLAPIIAETMGPDVRLVDSAAETALETARVLGAHGLLASGTEPPVHRFVASDAPDRFLALGRRFLHDAITAVEHVTFG